MTTSDSLAIPQFRPRKGEEYTAEVKERFDALLPKYGFLWKSMKNARLSQRSNNKDAADSTSKGGNDDRTTNSRNTNLPIQGWEDKENVDPSRRQTGGKLILSPEESNDSSSDSFDCQMVDSEYDNDGNDDNDVKSDLTDKQTPAAAEQNKDDANGTPFLDAILNKRPVKFRVDSPDHDLCGDDCNCADPILEIDDDNNDVNSNAEEFVESPSKSKVKPYGVKKCSIDSDDENEDGETLGDTSERSDDSIICLDDDEADEESDEEIRKSTRRNANKSRKFIVDSDDGESEDDNTENNMSGKNSVYNLDSDDESDHNYSQNSKSEATSKRSQENSHVGSNFSQHSLGNNSQDLSDSENLMDSEEEQDSASASEENTKTQPMQHANKSGGCDDGSTSEEEFVELSSDDDDSVNEQNPSNTVIILSSDDEESEESDRSEAFSISDDSDSDESIPNFRRTTKTKPPKKSTSYKTPSPPHPFPNKTPKPASTAKKGSRSTLSFQRNRDSLTSRTFAEFNKLAFQNALSSVEVSWSKKLNTTAGITRMKGKLGAEHATSRVASIELATKVIDDEDRLRSTLLHEMCHAAAWLVDGVHKPPHGRCFKKWASIAMKKIKDVEVTTTHDYQIAYKYAWACTAPKCTVVIKRHSRSVDPSRHCCGRCKSKLVEIEVPGSKGDTAKLGYTPKRERKEASGFALFVKQKSSEVREKLSQQRSCASNEISQADVMKECGRMWRAQKEGAKENDSVQRMANQLGIISLD